ncbi:MAG: hypothetical protein K8S62_04290 [Candidatus Sabulitectum sp.]|nr:hypothetical protein [Candidatus Sabulitectum sp.]
MRLLFAVSIFLVSTASAISIGFTHVSIPAYSNQFLVELESDEDIYMLTVGQKLGSALNLEVSFGYESEVYEEDAEYEYVYGNYFDKTVQAYGLGAFYRITGNDFVSFSLGARFIYSDLELAQDGEPDKLKTSARIFSPLARIDLSIPGVENLSLHTQFGANYRKVESTVIESYYDDYEHERTDFRITAPGEILAGIHYQF